MRLIGGFLTLALNALLVLFLPSLIIAFWSVAFLVGLFSTVFSFKSMK